MQDNYVTQWSMKLVVNPSDCTNTMRIKEDQNKHLNGKGLLLDVLYCQTKEMSGRLGLLVISKKA